MLDDIAVEVVAAIVAAVAIGVATLALRLWVTRRREKLSDDERELLVAAANPQDGYITHVRTFGGVQIEAGGREFVEGDNQRSAARWAHALQGLEAKGLIESIGVEDDVFEVTDAGFEIAGRL